MIQNLICCATMAFGAFAQEPSPVQCAVAPEPAVASVPMVDFAGIRYGFCCAGCAPEFSKEPAKFVAEAAKEDRVIGTSLFDPVTGIKIDPKKAAGGFLDSAGTRYYFATADGRKKFEAKPGDFNKVPAKVALYCPVMNHAVKSYADSGAYADHAGVRYFLCCPNCLGAFRAEPMKYIKNAEKAVMAPKAMPAPKAVKNG